MITTPSGDAAVIEAHALTKRYGDTLAVAGVDVVVRAGEVLAVLGPNGAGKTTTIEMLLGMRRPTSGTVALFGRRPDAAAVKARVGAMLQDVDTPQALTVAETVGLVRRYYPRGLAVADVLDRADLSTHAGKRAAQLSGGQRQRLSFAMAIVGAPDLLFLDEPTAALDVAARRRFWTQLRELAAAGTTILFASHNMAEVEALADRVLVVHRGRVVADGSPAYVASTVATRRLEVGTDLGADAVPALPGVVRAVVTGPPQTDAGRGGAEPLRYDVTSTDAEATVRALCATGATLDRLVVHDSDMETAFLHLVADDPAADHAAAASRESAA